MIVIARERAPPLYLVCEVKKTNTMREVTMQLKFIGVNGSMGLEHGKSYIVKVFSKDGYIWVEIWFIKEKTKKLVPYESPQSFARNWG